MTRQELIDYLSSLQPSPAPANSVATPVTISPQEAAVDFAFTHWLADDGSDYTTNPTLINALLQMSGNNTNNG